MSRILITGAGGFVGRSLTANWADREIVPLDIPDGDLSAYEPRWSDRFAGVETVVHLAGSKRLDAPFEELLRDNTLMTLNVVQACLAHGVRRIVFASSLWAEPERWDLPGLSLPAAPSWPLYTARWRASEAIICGWSAQTRNPAVCLRLAWFDADAPAGPTRDEAVRLSPAMLAWYFEQALAHDAPTCLTRYAVGRA